MALVMSALLLSGCGAAPTPATPEVTASASPSATLTESALKEAAAAFFDAYLRCMSEPPEAAAGHVSDYCQSHNPYATAALPAHLTAAGVAAAGADPITCGQNPPIDITVETATVTGDGSGTASVRAGYLPEPLRIEVDLTLVSGAALVDDVHCPSP